MLTRYPNTLHLDLLSDMGVGLDHAGLDHAGQHPGRRLTGMTPPESRAWGIVQGLALAL